MNGVLCRPENGSHYAGFFAVEADREEDAVAMQKQMAGNGRNGSLRSGESDVSILVRVDRFWGGGLRRICIGWRRGETLGRKSQSSLQDSHLFSLRSQDFVLGLVRWRPIRDCKSEERSPSACSPGLDKFCSKNASAYGS